MSRLSSHTALLTVLMALTGALAGSATANAKAHRTGDIVPIRGTVLDGQGRPLEGVEVVLEARRAQLRLRSFRRESGPPLRVIATTNAAGAFEIEWTWDRHHNEFELVVAHTQRDSGTVERFAHLDITALINAGGPVTTSIAVPEGSVLRWLRRYKGPTTEPERKVYSELGRPDRVDIALANDGDELSWWYFEHGKVYRFKDGGLLDVTRFEPVRPSS